MYEDEDYIGMYYVSTFLDVIYLTKSFYKVR